MTDIDLIDLGEVRLPICMIITNVSLGLSASQGTCVLHCFILSHIKRLDISKTLQLGNRLLAQSHQSLRSRGRCDQNCNENASHSQLEWLALKQTEADAGENEGEEGKSGPL